MFVFGVAYVAFDTAAGVATGVLMQAAYASGDTVRRFCDSTRRPLMAADCVPGDFSARIVCGSYTRVPGRTARVRIVCSRSGSNRSRGSSRPAQRLVTKRELAAAGVATLASQLRLLTFLLTNFAAVFAPLAAFGDHAGAGGMRAFLGAGHFTPPGAVLARLQQQRPCVHPLGEAKARLRYAEAETARALVLILPTFRAAGRTCVAR
jgi:hypothetical protein